MKLISSYAKRIGLFALAAAAMGAQPAPAWGEGAAAANATSANAAAPRRMASRLIGAAMSDGRAYQLAESLTDGVGPRPSGSDGAARAVKWAVEQMRALGLKNVHTEPVRVPRWIRGAGEAEVVAPAKQTMHVVALGPSVPTGPDGVTADVVVVGGFEELKSLGD